MFAMLNWESRKENPSGAGQGQGQWPRLGRPQRAARLGYFDEEREDRWDELKKNRCRWLPQTDGVLSSFPLSSEDTNHPALSRLPAAFCCSLAFISPLGPNMLPKLLCQHIDGIHRCWQFKLQIKASTFSHTSNCNNHPTIWKKRESELWQTRASVQCVPLLLYASLYRSHSRVDTMWWENANRTMRHAVVKCSSV